MKTLGVIAAAAALTVVVAPQTARAVPLDGYFIALKACPALQSKNSGTNPGAVTTEPMRAYEMLEINKVDGDYYRMRVPGAPTLEERWVSAECGLHVIAADGQTPPPVDAPTPPDRTPPPDTAGRESTQNLLTVSWQAAFCETRPSKTECEILNDGELPAAETQLSIHGLWPQPNGTFYCGSLGQAHEATDKAGNWHLLPAPKLSAATREALEAAMPGHLSQLDRHEWIKHGTCFFGEDGAEEYFADTLVLMDQLNASAVKTLLASSIGQFVSGADIRAAFDDAFGDGAGARVEINCATDRDSGRRLITELWINLEGTITADADLGELMRAAPTIRQDCAGGIVDPAGNQR